ncbi:hypothetical protein VTJ04DRAFT_7359 [Mycothermus thermophilus]|uniref:uncharacterized protein n=1 Tax=Humicola insolens TaxID=85995 RepID=UPI00374417B1
MVWFWFGMLGGKGGPAVLGTGAVTKPGRLEEGKDCRFDLQLAFRCVLSCAATSTDPSPQASATYTVSRTSHGLCGEENREFSTTTTQH